MPFLSKYGVARHIYIPMVKRGVVDHAVSADWTPAAGDVKISKDGGATASVTNLPVAIAMGNSTIWDFSLTATEMQAAQVMVTIADSATKAVEDSAFVIETHGNASGQFQVDLADSVRAGLTALPNATVSGVGGLLTAPTTANVGLADLSRILGTALTETAGQIAAGVKKLFDVAAPVFTLLSVNQTGDAYARLGAPAGASVSADVAAVKVDTAAVKVQTDKMVFTVVGYLDVNAYKWVGGTIPAVNVTGVPLIDLKYTLGTISPATAGSVRADAVTGAVGSVTGNVGGNVVGSVASVTAAVTIAAASIQAIWDALTSALTTVGSIGKLLVTNIDAAISSRSTYAGGDTSGTTTLLGRLTSTRAGLLDNLDAAVSTRLATSGYTAPDNTDIAAIKVKTDSLTFTVAGKVDSDVTHVNGHAVTGDGHAGTEWGPA